MKVQRRVSVLDFRKAVADKKPTEDLIVCRAEPATIETDERGDRVWTISTPDVDRQGDTIAVDGWDLSAFQKAGCVLWAHDYSSLPIAKPKSTWVQDGKLKSIPEFSPAGINPFADMVRQLVDAGFLKSASVGFRPLAYNVAQDRASDGWCPPMDFIRQELLEWSIVPVPANPAALLDAKTMGIDLDPLAEWSAGVLGSTKSNRIWLPGDRAVTRRALEDIYEATQSAQRTFLLGVSREGASATRGTHNPDSAGSTPAPATTETPAAPAAPAAAKAAEPAPVAPAAAPVAPAQPAEKTAATLPVHIDNSTAKLAQALDKSGRVLSAVNEERLRKASDLLDEVLSQLEPAPTQEDSIDLETIVDDDEVDFQFDAEPSAVGAN